MYCDSMLYCMFFIFYILISVYIFHVEINLSCNAYMPGTSAVCFKAALGCFACDIVSSEI